MNWASWENMIRQHKHKHYYQWIIYIIYANVLISSCNLVIMLNSVVEHSTDNVWASNKQILTEQFDVIKIHFLNNSTLTLFVINIFRSKFKSIVSREGKQKNSIEPILSVKWLLTKRKYGYVVSKNNILIECKWLKHAMMTAINALSSSLSNHWKRNSWPNCILIKEHKKGCDSIHFHSSIESIHRASIHTINQMTNKPIFNTAKPIQYHFNGSIFHSLKKK